MPLPVLAHGFGGAGDLPVPFPLLLYGSGAVVLGTAALLSHRRTAATAKPEPPALATLERSSAVRRLAALLGLLLWGLALLPAALGADDPRRNPLPLLAYDVFWVVLLPLSFVVGPLWRLLNPLRALSAGLARVAGDPGELGAAPLPGRWGLWPAAVVLLAVAGVVATAGQRPFVLAGLFTGYMLVQAGAAAVYGRDWYARGDGFEVASSLAGALSPLGRSPGGQLVLRSPVAAVPAEPSLPGLTAVTAVLVGRHLGDAFSGIGGARQLAQFQAAWLLPAAALLVGTGLAYAIAAWSTRGGMFAPALVPVALGYQAAHDVAVFGVQLGVPGVLLAVARLVVFVGGHLLAVEGGHDLAVARCGPTSASAARTPLMAALTISTVGGVALLFGGD